MESFTSRPPPGTVHFPGHAFFSGERFVIKYLYLPLLSLRQMMPVTAMRWSSSCMGVWTMLGKLEFHIFDTSRVRVQKRHYDSIYMLIGESDFLFKRIHTLLYLFLKFIKSGSH